ncbi:MAG: hypothetical protein SNJ53_08645, partial [Thermodesulfovibrionales bacterium]
FATTSEETNIKCQFPRPIFIRRARGYVPEPIRIGGGNAEVIGCGSDIKNVFAITKAEYAILSQHIGDMENDATISFFEQTLKNLSEVYRFTPCAVGYDLNPDYYSSRLGQEISERLDIPSFRLQHHECHIASVVAEWGIDRDVIGVSFDGAGYGWDGSIWGSEFMYFDGMQFKRLARFHDLVLPGGDLATKQCWRCALSLMRNNLTEDDYWQYVRRLGFIEDYGEATIANITNMIDKKISSTISSGAGRYFDAVSYIVDACRYNTYEGEAGIALESLAYHCDKGKDECYPFFIDKQDQSYIKVDFKETLYALLNDRFSKTKRETIALRFHNTLINIVTDVVKNCVERCKTHVVVLSGGVLQNNLFLKGVIQGLIKEGLKVYFNSQVPLNDGGIALGQVYLVRKYLQ